VSRHRRAETALRGSPGRSIRPIFPPTRDVHRSAFEDDEPAAVPFDEIWHLTKPADGSRGWVVAGIQQTH